MSQSRSHVIYRHFKGGFYSLLGEAMYLVESEYAALIEGVICHHEASGGSVKAKLYLGAGGRLFIKAIEDQDKAILDDQTWTLYQSLVDGRIWMRPNTDMFDKTEASNYNPRFQPIA